MHQRQRIDPEAGDGAREQPGAGAGDEPVDHEEHEDAEHGAEAQVTSSGGRCSRRSTRPASGPNTRGCIRATSTGMASRLSAVSPGRYSQKGKRTAIASSAEHTPSACSYTIAALTRSTDRPCEWLIQARPTNMKTLPGT